MATQAIPNNQKILPFRILDTCDYIPVVSSITNTGFIFNKCIGTHVMNCCKIKESDYCKELKQKSYTRCVILLVPVLGNVVIGLYDCITNNKKVMSSLVGKNSYFMVHANKRLGDDKDFMLAAYEEDAENSFTRVGGIFNLLRCTSDRLKDDEDFMTKIILANAGSSTVLDIIENASERLRNKPSFTQNADTYFNDIVVRFRSPRS